MRKKEMSRVFRGSRSRGFLIQRHRRSAIESKWTPQIDWARIGPGGRGLSWPRPRLRPGRREWRSCGWARPFFAARPRAERGAREAGPWDDFDAGPK